MRWQVRRSEWCTAFEFRATRTKWNGSVVAVVHEANGGRREALLLGWMGEARSVPTSSDAGFEEAEGRMQPRKKHADLAPARMSAVGEGRDR